MVFSSNPNATGGPVLRSAPGQLLLAGQQPRQRLQQPGTLINSVQFKTLGLIPGTATQQGTLAILDGNRYEVRVFGAYSALVSLFLIVSCYLATARADR